MKDQIDALHKSILESTKNYNNILKLMKLYEAFPQINKLTDSGDSQSIQTLRYLTVSLFKIFYKLSTKLQLNPSMASNANEKLLFQWLKKLYELNFKKNVLLNYMVSMEYENSLSMDCLDIYMKCIELEATFFASKMGAPYFPNKTLSKLIETLFSGASSSSNTNKQYLFDQLSENYYKKYVDIQYYFQIELQELISAGSIPYETQTSSYWLALMDHDNHYDNANSDLAIFVPNPPSTMENEIKFKTQFEKNWIFILSNPQTTSYQFKQFLTILHKRIIPHFVTPTKLMDFLTDCYDNVENDLSVQLLSLNGLFELMKNYNLEYPNFYTKLYALFKPELFHLKYRSRFLRLIDIFLRSSHLSSNLIAGFMKKMSRSLLTSSPNAIVSVIPMIYNLLKLHPNCMILIHDPDYINPYFTNSKGEIEQRIFHDAFDINEPNPEFSNAINSSLWELETLMHHYHPNVASLAKIFQQPFRKMSYNMEDFLDWNYKSFLNSELKRSLKILPALDHQNKGECLFADGNTDVQNLQNDVYMDAITW
ncbi:hypothetical protein ACO0RG_001573 [Hanseniaspora osmophila]